LRSELLQGAQLLLVHCGRLSPEKEPQRSIEALEKLIADGIDARLVIIGNGPLWSKLRERSRGLPVDMLGYVADRKRVSAILASADISLAPGPLETFCLSALESLASGTPVVASQSSAVGEFLRHAEKNPAGAIAEDHGAAFASAIERIAFRPALRKVARGSAERLPWGLHSCPHDATAWLRSDWESGSKRFDKAKVTHRIMTMILPSLTFTVIGDSAAFGTGDLDENGNPRGWGFYLSQVFKDPTSYFNYSAARGTILRSSSRAIREGTRNRARYLCGDLRWQRHAPKWF
jgi:hypothetical protein